MNINKIDFIKYNSYPHNPRKETETTGTVGIQQEQIKEYKPHAYMDYNINFGARLFRTPANFYAQPFNQKGMPITMKNYLNEDYEDRQNIPPAQMMSIVYGDIKEAKSLEQVKKMYPEEPLFQNLHEVNYESFRSGALGDIMLLKDDKHPLFKDGSDDLGMYLLKKIYVECKSMKEIVPDFRKDISEYYKDIADIDYTTIKNFGIGYPNNGFWKSLTATREEFPFTHKPRKNIKSRINGNEQRERSIYDALEKRGKIYPEKPTHNLPDHEIQRITETIFNSGGNITESEKQIKRKHRNKNEEKEINFVCKYLGPIMSITLDRIHASDEMRDFFNNYEATTKSQKKKMQEYWKEHPDMKELQSIIMSDTIKLFFELYGADGENKYFKEILDYANSIKSNREIAQKEHEEKQKYYEDLFAELDEVKAEENPAEINSEKHITTYEELGNKLDDLLKKYNASLYKFEIDGDEYNLIFDPKDVYKEIAKVRFGDNVPEAWIQKYSKYTYDNLDVKYILSLIKHYTKIEVPIPDEHIFTPEETAITISKKDKEFQNKFSKETNAAITALMHEYFSKTHDINTVQELYYDTRIGVLFGNIDDVIKEKELKGIIDKNNINEKYNEYRKPLSNSETNKIVTELMSTLKQYSPKQKDDIKISILLGALSLMVQVKDDNCKNFRSELSQFIQNNYGGAARSIIDKKLSDDMRMEQIIHVICEYNSNKPGELVKYISNNNISHLFLLRNQHLMQ